MLKVIAHFWREGRSPTTAELLQALRLATVSGLDDLLNPVENRGYIQIERPGRGKQRRFVLTSLGRWHTGLGFPIVGRITAGVLREAFEEDAEWVDNTDSHLGVKPRDFGLWVDGDSMINAHIINGDCVVIRPGIRHVTQEMDGKIVAALVGGGEGVPALSTLKYLDFLKEPDWFRLRAANPDYEDIIVNGEELRIAGVAKGLMRKLDD